MSKSNNRTSSVLVSPPPARPSRWPKRFAGLVIAATVAIVGTCGAWQVYRASAGTPKPALEQDPWHRGHRVLDRDGNLLRELTSSLGARGHELGREQVGARLIAATLMSEDREFYKHDGVDRAAIARAVKQNIAHGRLVSGASTITQQLVKLLDTRGVPQARGISDKLREAARAQNLERLLDKDEILVAYMNRLPYGHGLTGPDAAARGYFGVASSDLSWAQAAFMAVLPRAPSFLDPYRHIERVRLRQKALLRALADAGELTSVELQRSLAEPIELQPLAHPFLAPHLVEHLRIHDLFSDGQETTTSLDSGLQADVEGLTRTHLAELVAAGAQDAAVIVLDNATGEVLTYVGSADFHDPVISGQVDMVQARRQPGSTLKPFVYAMAFENGRTAADPLADVPTRFVES
ncbi:MAG: transglycosylase domain-containing protein, partial [Nannocystaceae bacterium]